MNKDYKLHIFILKKDEQNIKKKLKDILILLQQCFFHLEFIKNMSIKDLRIFLINSIVFYFKDINKIIAIAIVQSELINIYNFNIPPYKLLYPKTKEEYNKYINPLKKKRVSPYLKGLCRDKGKKYKGTGKYLMEKIIEFIKNKTKYKYLYLTAESNLYRSISTQMCGIYDEDKYEQSQLNLLKYYKKMKFKICKNHYEMEICKDKNNVNLFLFFILMRKKI